jgi:Tfp pilus assembly major pilin PilA
MKSYDIKSYQGFVLLELLMVFVILAALASIAIPQYARYKSSGYKAQCESNRYHIELEEHVYYAEHGIPGLMIDDKYKCPSNGTYVWLVSDPDDPDYPRIGCSVHFIGDDGSTGISTGSSGNEAAENAIRELIDYVIGLDLDGGVENSMLAKLTSASDFLQLDQGDSAMSVLESFINYAEAQKGKKLPVDKADTLILKAQHIIEILTHY